MREEVRSDLIADYIGPLEVKNNPLVTVYLFGVCETCGMPRVVKKAYSGTFNEVITLEVICTDRPQQHRRFLSTV